MVMSMDAFNDQTMSSTNEDSALTGMEQYRHSESADDEQNEDELSKGSNQTVVVKQQRTELEPAGSIEHSNTNDDVDDDKCQQTAMIVSREPSIDESQRQMMNLDDEYRNLSANSDQPKESELDGMCMAREQSTTSSMKFDHIGAMSRIDPLVAQMRDIVDGGRSMTDVHQPRQSDEQTTQAKSSSDSLNKQNEHGAERPLFDETNSQKRPRHPHGHCRHHRHHHHHHHHHHAHRHRQSIGSVSIQGNEASTIVMAGGSSTSQGHNHHHHHRHSSAGHKQHNHPHPHHHHHHHHHHHPHYYHHHHNREHAGTSKRSSIQRPSLALIDPSGGSLNLVTGTQRDSEEKDGVNHDSISSISSGSSNQNGRVRKQNQNGEPSQSYLDSKSSETPTDEKNPNEENTACSRQNLASDYHVSGHHHHHHHHNHRCHHRGHRKRLILDSSSDVKAKQDEQESSEMGPANSTKRGAFADLNSDLNIESCAKTSSGNEYPSDANRKQGARQHTHHARTHSHSHTHTHPKHHPHSSHHHIHCVTSDHKLINDHKEVDGSKHVQQHNDRSQHHHHRHHRHHNHCHHHHGHHCRQQRHKSRPKSNSRSNLELSSQDISKRFVNETGEAKVESYPEDRKLIPLASQTIVDARDVVDMQTSDKESKDDRVVEMETSPSNEGHHCILQQPVEFPEEQPTKDQNTSSTDLKQADVSTHSQRTYDQNTMNQSHNQVREGELGNYESNKANQKSSQNDSTYNFDGICDVSQENLNKEAKKESTSKENKLTRQMSSQSSKKSQKDEFSRDGQNQNQRMPEYSLQPLQSVTNQQQSQTTQIIETSVPNDRRCRLCWCCCCPCSALSSRDVVNRIETVKVDADPSGSPTNKCTALQNVSLDEIRSWGESFDKLMRCQDGRKVFQDFLRCEYSEENILFWTACEDLKKERDSKSIASKARDIYEDYISILSSKEVSLDSRVRDIINTNIKKPTSNIFDEAQLQIYTLMHRDSYPRFINSAMYKKLAHIPTNSSRKSSS